MQKCPKTLGLFTRHSWVEKSCDRIRILHDFAVSGMVTKERTCSVCGEKQVCVDDCGCACGEQWVKLPFRSKPRIWL